ncbi:MAG TPA: hypothetical protein VF648_04160 [Pyrinomonadaceae bacterium]|jgi:hypothetical protein
MANENSRLSGTVIQRTFIPDDLGIVLHIATVPLEDIYENYEEDNSEEFLTQIVAEILAIPKQSILSQNQYERLSRSISNGFFRRPGFYRRIKYPFWDEFYHEGFAYFEREVTTLMESSTESNNPFGSRLALHSIGLMANPTIAKSDDFHFPFFAFRDLRVADRRLGDQLRNVSRESLETGFACLLSNINPDERVTNFLSEIQKYEIPSGQSPETKSESLAQLIRTSRSVCIAPIIAGSTVAATHLGQGAYVAALLDVGTGAAATLILVSGISVAEVIARKLAEKRGRSRISSSRKKANYQKKLEENKPKEIKEGESDESSES